MKRVFYVAAMMIASILGANAAIYDLGEIVLGQTYTIPDEYNFGSVTGTLTAPESGLLTVTGLNGSVELFSDINHDEHVECVWNGAYGPSYAVDYTVEGNKVYYAYCNFLMLDASTNFLRFEMANAIALTVSSTNPEQGEPISPLINATGSVVINFSAAVTYDSAKLSKGDVSMSVSSGITTASAFVAVPVGDALKAWYRNGTLKEEGGEALTLTLEGIKTNTGIMYDGTGELSLNFVSAPKSPELVKANIPTSDLKSYYPAGDPDALYVFEFDKNLKNDESTMLIFGMGNVEVEGGYYYEQIVPVIDGNKVTVDVSGKLRELNDYIQYQGSSIVEVKLINVVDVNGTPAAGGGSGLSNSYVWNLNYVYIQPEDIVSEFMPADGGSLEGVNSVEIWFNHADNLRFDGVKFACPDATEVVPFEELDITDEGSNAKVIIAQIPESIKGKKGVTVTLNNLVSLDGYDHSQQIMARYDQFVVTLVAPIQPGEALTSTGDDDFVITVNGDYNYIRYDFYNQISSDNPTGWAYGTDFHKQDNGTWTSYNGNYKCYTDFTPRMLIRAYEDEASYWNELPAIGECEFTFKGLIGAFVYSPVQFVNITPEPNSVIELPVDNFCFTVQYDGLVKLDPDKTKISLGFGMSQKFESLEGVDAEDGYANTWKLYPGNAFMNNNPGIDIAIVAYDMDGYLVRGNMSEGETDYLSFSYLIENPESAVELTITPAAGTEVESLSKFVVSTDDALGLNANYDGNMPLIMNSSLETVYTFTEDDCEVMSDIIEETEVGPVYSELTRVEMSVNPAITVPGTYWLVIPEKFFIVGSQFLTNPSAAFSGEYTIKSSGINSVIIQQAERYEVYNLQGIKVLSTANAADLSTLRPGIYLINGKKVAVK